MVAALQTAVQDGGSAVKLVRERASRLAGFALVWVALVVFTVDGVRHSCQHVRIGVAEEAALACEPT